MTSVDSSPDNESRHVVEALGELVLAVSSLEESLHDAIWLLSGADNRAVHVLTAGLQFRTLVEKLGAIAIEMKSARVPVADVIDFCKHLDTLNERRNTIIHSAWNLQDEGHRRFKRSAKPKSGFLLNVERITAADIHLVANQFREAQKRLWEIPP